MLTVAEATFSLVALEDQLVSYLKNDSAVAEPFDITSVPKISRQQAQAEMSTRPSALETIASTSAVPERTASPSKTPESQSNYASQLAEIPEFAAYGAPLKSTSKPIPLTDQEAEYSVTAVKHIFKEHVVFQFNVSNTIPDTVLEQVSVIMLPDEDTDLTEDFIIPVPSLTTTSGTGTVYVSFTRTDPASYSTASYGCTLKFISKEVDPASGEPEEEGYDDEYQVENIDVCAGDYIIPTYLNFASEWDKLANAPQETETFALSASESLRDACKSLIEVLGMEPLGGTEIPASNSVHTLNMAGIVAGGGGKVLARCRMTFSPGEGVTLELGVRAEQDEATKLVMAAI